jgi:hypothetical protein
MALVLVVDFLVDIARCYHEIFSLASISIGSKNSERINEPHGMENEANSNMKFPNNVCFPCRLLPELVIRVSFITRSMAETRKERKVMLFHFVFHYITCA